MRIMNKDGDSNAVSYLTVAASTNGYGADWCVNHSRQSNQFVDKPVEVEEENRGFD